MMNNFRKLLALVAVAFAAQAAAQVTVYEHADFRGRSFTAQQIVPNMNEMGFNDRASSIEVVGERWEVCDDMRFRGNCVVLRPGRYSSLAALGLNDRMSSMRAIDRDERIDESRYAPLPNRAAQIVLYANENFRGESITSERPINRLERVGFNNRASSIEVIHGSWEVCEAVAFGGRCVVLMPGRYASLQAMGLSDRASSMRVASARVAQIVLYANENFRGESIISERPINRLERVGFNNRASSIDVIHGNWEVCEAVAFGGRCVVLVPGRYASLQAMGLSDRASSMRVAGRSAPAPVATRAIFYQGEYFQGRSFTTGQSIANMDHFGFNDRASSVEISGERWEICEAINFGGRCVVLRPGRYPSLAAMGLNNRASSARDIDANTRIEDGRYGPPARSSDFRRRGDERLYQANVTSVRAIGGTPEQRCWMEQEQTAAQSGGANVPGAIIGGILGGILGHQVGGGSGKDIATVGGVVAGAVVGANVNRGTTLAGSSRDVQRCEAVTSQARPSYWDVTYNFRGQEHRMQMNVAPGPTVTVNEQGEPRV